MENRYCNIDKLLFAMATVMWGCAFLGSSAMAYVGLVTYQIGQFAFWLTLSVVDGWLMLHSFKLATR
jgi:hypothetical protein